MAAAGEAPPVPADDAEEAELRDFAFSASAAAAAAPIREAGNAFTAAFHKSTPSTESLGSRERRVSVMVKQSGVDWSRVQAKTFARWINLFLVQRGKQLGDLAEGLNDGIKLMHLLELITGKRVGKLNLNPKWPIHRLENINMCLDFLQREGVRLVNVGAQDIEQGNTKIILGLVWRLVLKYQMEESADSAARANLLRFVNERIASAGLQVSDFGRSWSDGRALTALVNALAVAEQNADARVADVGGREPVRAIDAAMEAAEDHFNIPRVMDAADVAHSPDEQSLMTYVSYFHRRWQSHVDRLRDDDDKQSRVSVVSAISEHRVSRAEPPPPPPPPPTAEAAPTASSTAEAATQTEGAEAKDVATADAEAQTELTTEAMNEFERELMELRDALQARAEREERDFERRRRERLEWETRERELHEAVAAAEQRTQQQLAAERERARQAALAEADARHRAEAAAEDDAATAREREWARREEALRAAWAEELAARDAAQRRALDEQRARDAASAAEQRALLEQERLDWRRRERALEDSVRKLEDALCARVAGRAADAPAPPPPPAAPAAPAAPPHPPSPAVDELKAQLAERKREARRLEAREREWREKCATLASKLLRIREALAAQQQQQQHPQSRPASSSVSGQQAAAAAAAAAAGGDADELSMAKRRLEATREEFRRLKAEGARETEELRRLLVETQQELTAMQGRGEARKQLVESARQALLELKPWVGIEVPPAARMDDARASAQQMQQWRHARHAPLKKAASARGVASSAAPPLRHAASERALASRGSAERKASEAGGDELREVPEEAEADARSESGRPTSPTPSETSNFGFGFAEAPHAGGVVVSRVKVGGPAMAAGFKMGDIIEQVDGEPVEGNAHLRRIIDRIRVGDTLVFQVLRDWQVLNVRVEVGSKYVPFSLVSQLRRIASGVVKPGDERALKALQQARGGEVQRSASAEHTEAAAPRADSLRRSKTAHAGMMAAARRAGAAGDKPQ